MPIAHALFRLGGLNNDMFKSFKMWVEDIEARRIGSRDVILNFLKTELHITDDATILGMSTKDMDPSIISKLLNRGIISTSSPDIMDRIKNGVTVDELVDLLASDASANPTPMPPPNGV
jgi:hypothetical protein